jgi:hypothetical protein
MIENALLPKTMQTPSFKLWKLCRDFIEDHKIQGPDYVKTFRIMDGDAVDFVAEVCKIVGYHEQVNDETSSVADQSRDQTSEPNLTEEDLAECRRRFEEYNKEALQILRGSGR